MKNVTLSSGLTPAVWEAVTAFHGHACPGLALGCRMALAALSALGLVPSPPGVDASGEALGLNVSDTSMRPPISPDEELVCVAETDACCVDAVQFLLGCTLGKGNLLLKFRGKTALSFYHRPSGKAVRVLWIAPFAGPSTGGASPESRGESPAESREARMERYLYGPAKGLYTVTPIPFAPPERARISASLPCAACGELTAEPMVRLQDGKPYCLDCFSDASRIL